MTDISREKLEALLKKLIGKAREVPASPKERTVGRAMEGGIIAGCLSGLQDVIETGELDADTWIPVSTPPAFDETVVCWSEFSGRWVGSYFQIGDTQHGNWWNHLTDEKGYLPPTLWAPLPTTPVEE